jgi:hypothetical protein
MRLVFDGLLLSGIVVAEGAMVSAALVDALLGAIAAPGPHSALRNSFQLMPLSVLAVCAARYLVLHSCMLRACAGMLQVKTTIAAVAKSERETIDIAHELRGCVARECHWRVRSPKRQRSLQRKARRAVYGRRTRLRSFKSKISSNRV